jgi:hypothetical protein
MKVNAVFSPRVAKVDQRELAPEEWMERMSDPEELPSI